MFKQKSSRTKNLIIFGVFDYLKSHKWHFLICFAVCGLFLVLGFVVGASRASEFSLADLPDGTLVAFITKKTSCVALFFSRLFSFLWLVLIVWILNSKTILSWIGFVVIAYQSFLNAINSAILIAVYGFSGMLGVLICFLPLKILILIAVIVWQVNCFCGCKNQKRTGESVLTMIFLKQSLKVLILVIIIGFLACFLESLLLHYLTNIVFVGVT